MHVSSGSPLGSRSNPLVGIGFKVASVGFFLAMSSFLKASGDVPAGELVFFRSCFAIIPIVLFMALTGQLPGGLRTKRPLGHLWRGLVGVSSMTTSFFALTRLPLPEAITINYATPLIIVVLSAVFYREVVRLYRWSAVLIGLVGVVIIVWPRLTVFSGGVADLNGGALGAISALISCFFAALAMVQVRSLVHTERSATIALYLSVTCTLISLLSLPFGWIVPTPTQAVFLVSAGIAGGIGQILLTESYRHAEMSVIAPFEYSSLLLSVAVGYVFFGDSPTIEMLVGGAIVIASGLFIVYREHALGLERTAERQATPVTGVGEG